jgi:hypothetical protein
MKQPTTINIPSGFAFWTTNKNMLKFLKDRIAVIVLLVAGDSISLISFIKAPEIKSDCRNLAISISLLLSLILSLCIRYFIRGELPKWAKGSVLVVALLCWVGYGFAFKEFSHINASYAMIPYPSNQQLINPVDSLIVGGCTCTAPAQAEIEHMLRSPGMIDWNKVFADFNYDVHQVWTEVSQQCARDKILWSFSAMIAFLVAGVTLTVECILLVKNT